MVVIIAQEQRLHREMTRPKTTLARETPTLNHAMIVAYLIADIFGTEIDSPVESSR